MAFLFKQRSIEYLQVKIMDANKLVSLKANVVNMQYISLADIKMFFSVNDQEAQELLDKIIQCGLVQPFPLDGVHFKVNR